MKARQTPRFPVRLQSRRSADEHLDTSATVLDLSLYGCRISSTTPVNPGMVFALCLEVPGGEEPIHIAQAAVRWVRGEEFGLSFLAFTSNAHERLVAIIQELRHQNEGGAAPPSRSSNSL